MRGPSSDGRALPLLRQDRVCVCAERTGAAGEGGEAKNCRGWTGSGTELANGSW